MKHVPRFQSMHFELPSHLLSSARGAHTSQHLISIVTHTHSRTPTKRKLPSMAEEEDSQKKSAHMAAAQVACGGEHTVVVRRDGQVGVHGIQTRAQLSIFSLAAGETSTDGGRMHCALIVAQNSVQAISGKP